jgi:YD repeat-containing protein
MAAVVFGVVAFGATSSSANVGIRTGNFYIGYTDAIATGGLKMHIERVYNAKATFSSIFGYGWGAEFLAYISPQDDGSLILHEYGGGADNHFDPPSSMVRTKDDIISELIAAAETSGKLTSDDDRAKYRVYLQDHHEQVWEQDRANHLVPAVPQPAGEPFTSLRFGRERMTRTPTGFQRQISDPDRTEDFDEVGHIVHVTDSDRNYIAYVYDDDHYLTEMRDNVGNSFTFTYTPDHHVQSIRDAHGRLATYRYQYDNNMCLLVYSKSMDGRVNRYTYNSNADMLSATFNDKTTMQMRYDEQDNIIYLKDRDGTITRYHYTQQQQGDLLDDVITVDLGPKGVTTYEYWGTSNTYRRTVETVNGATTDTSYDSSGRTLAKTTRDGTTHFSYNAQGELILRETPTDRTVWTYDSTGKVTDVTTTPLSLTASPSPSTTGNTHYVYDQSGKLTRATDGHGNDVSVTYDDNGRVLTMTNQGATVRFAYSQLGKPNVLTLDGVGVVTITYDANGNFSRSSSPGGETVITKVTTMIRTVLDVVRPSGVTFNF